MQPDANRRRLPVEDRRAEIVAAAVRLLSARSPESLSLAEVAVEAGASRALVYHYFRDRKTLHSAAIHTAASELVDRLQPADLHPLDQIQHSLLEYVCFAEEHADAFVAILRGGTIPAGEHDEIVEVVDGVRRAVLDLVVHTLGLGSPSVTLRLCVDAWVSFAQQMAVEWLANRELDRDELHQLLVRHLLATLVVASTTDPAVGDALGKAYATADEATVPDWLADYVPS